MTRIVGRFALIVFFTALSAATIVIEMALPWHPWSSFGIPANPYGTITAVSTDAARAGVRPGDRVDLARMPLSDRLYINALGVAVEGTRLRVPLATGRTVTLTAQPVPRTLSDNVSDILLCLGLLFYIILAAALVLMRPSPVTWTFYLFSFSICFGGTEYIAYLPVAGVIATQIFGALTQPLGAAALFSFALRFPDAPLSSGMRRAELAALALVLPLLVALRLAAFVLYASGAIAPANTLKIVALPVQGLLVAGAIVVLLARYVTAEHSTRSRLQWMVAAMTLSFMPWTSIVIAESVFGIRPSNSVVNYSLLFVVFAPIALAYTILKHRLYDIRLVVSRALVYAVLTSMTVGLLALVDWAFGRWLAQSRFAIVGELVLAVVIGVALTTAHRRIERSLNNLIFRAQTLALHALRRFTQEIDLIPDPERLLMQTYDALRMRLESEYVTIYAADGASFVAATPHADAVPALLPTDDFAVLRLRRWSEAFECDEPEHALRGALLLPMTARTQLVGFIACGPKRDRTHYLPEEVETLSALAHRAGSAYGWMTVRQPLAPMEART